MNILKWILYFLLAVGIVLIIETKFKNKSNRTRIILIVVKLLLGVILAFLVMAGPIIMRLIQYICTTLYIVLICDAFGDLIFLFIKKKNFIINKVVSLVLCIIYFVYGTINMGVITKKEYTIDAGLDNEYKFAFLSDLHVGNSQSIDTTLKALDEINNLDLDFIILGGDVTDNFTSKENMETFYNYLNNMKCNVYLIYGNHDKQFDTNLVATDTYNKEEIEEAISNSKVIELEDSGFVFDELAVIGRRDKTNTNREDIDYSLYNDKYIIEIDHQPTKVDKLNCSVDLELSGHTHAGQFAPLGLMYRAIGPAYGMYENDDTKLIVTSGLSGWRLPFRTDHHSEYVVVTIK